MVETTTIIKTIWNFLAFLFSTLLLYLDLKIDSIILAVGFPIACEISIYLKLKAYGI